MPRASASERSNRLLSVMTSEQKQQQRVSVPLRLLRRRVWRVSVWFDCQCSWGHLERTHPCRCCGRQWKGELGSARVMRAGSREEWATAENCARTSCRRGSGRRPPWSAAQKRGTEVSRRSSSGSGRSGGCEGVKSDSVGLRSLALCDELVQLADGRLLALVLPRLGEPLLRQHHRRVHEAAPVQLAQTLGLGAGEDQIHIRPRAALVDDARLCREETERRAVELVGRSVGGDRNG